MRTFSASLEPTITKSFQKARVGDAARPAARLLATLDAEHYSNGVRLHCVLCGTVCDRAALLELWIEPTWKLRLQIQFWEKPSQTVKLP